MKNVVVLGARGFIGKNTVEYLSNNEKYKVYAATRKEVDLLNEEEVEKYLDACNADIIICCANQGGTRKNTNAVGSVIENNLRMFFNVERCITAERKMINFGSGAQYNKKRDLKKICEDEFEKYVPLDEYGYSKYVMSKYIKQREHVGGKGSITNPVIFGLYGIGEDYSYRFISNAIIKNILKMPIIINQDVVFDYLYIKDYFRVLDYMLEDKIKKTEFNVTPTQSIKLTEIAEIINKIGQYKSEIILKNEGFNYEYTGSNSRLLEDMGTDYTFWTYEAAIKEMYEYYLKNIDQLDLQVVREDVFIKNCITK